MRKLLMVLALVALLTPQANAGKYGSGSSSSFGRSSSSSFGRSSSSFGGSKSYGKSSYSAPKYSSGSKPTSKYSSGHTSTTPKPSGNKYSSGTKDKPIGRSSSKLDQSGQLAKQKVDSKNSYKPQAPKTEWKDPKTGKTRSFTKSEKEQVSVVRKTVTHERYVTYESRYHDFYSPYGYYGRPMVYYSDPFGPFFYLWLFDHATAQDRAYWAYNHRQQMDDARWRDMCAKDAQLEARVRQLEADKRARDPSYVPSGLQDNPDLMYNKSYIDAAYNPSPAVYHESSGGGSSFGTVLFWFLIVLVVVAVGGFVIWFIFVRET